MDRMMLLRDGLGKRHDVLEIGAYFRPIAARRDGYRVTTLDIFDAAELRRRAAADSSLGPDDVARIEEVDLVGSACDLADLTAAKYGPGRRFDLILSSHNIEHLPDPIRFLQQCAAVLGPGGILRMAVPDKRFCFDHFRPVSEVSEWLQAFHERRTQPTRYQLFRESAYHSAAGKDRRWKPLRQTLQSYRTLFATDPRLSDGYIDTHCWAFTPESFELLALDVRAFGLVGLEVGRITEPVGLEFFVDLRPTDPTATFSEDDYFADREVLMERYLAAEARGVDGVLRRGIGEKVVREAARMGRQVVGLVTRHDGAAAHWPVPRAAAAARTSHATRRR